MNNSTIIETIDKYIEKSVYRYALMINGKWGCGKTYFIKKTLIDHLKQKKKEVVYVSLYGVKEADEIGKSLFIRALKGKNKKLGELLDSKAGQITTAILSSAMKYGMKHLKLNNIGIKNIVSKGKQIDVDVLILDDLERCSCDINEVLGYVNSFVEHSNTKVILVANEEEIGKWQLEQNRELQLGLSLDNRINIEEKGLETQLNLNADNRNENVQKRYTLEQIEDRRKKLFAFNEKYKRVKEKVVGLTIQFNPDLQVAYKTIIEEAGEEIDEAFRQILLGLIKEFVFISERKEHPNIRTFQFFFEKMLYLYSLITPGFEEILPEVFRYAFVASVRLAKGEKKPEWDGNVFGEFWSDDTSEYPRNEVGFAFIDDYIENDCISEEMVQEALQGYLKYKREKGLLDNDAYGRLRLWNIYPDSDLKNDLKCINENIQRGDYSTSIYLDILKQIAVLESYGVFDEECNDIFNSMLNSVERKANEGVEEPCFQQFFYGHPNDAKAAMVYKDWYDKLLIAIRNVNYASEGELYNKSVLDHDNWGKNLSEIVCSPVRKNYTFIHWLMPELVFELLENGSNSQVYNFRFALVSCYERHLYKELKDDKENLARLEELLENSLKNHAGSIKYIEYTWIIDEIKKIVNTLQ